LAAARPFVAGAASAEGGAWSLARAPICRRAGRDSVDHSWVNLSMTGQPITAVPRSAILGRRESTVGNSKMADKIKVKVGHPRPLPSLIKGKHTFMMALDDEIMVMLGKIVVYWGAFEVRMDSLIETISDRMRRPSPPGWRRMSFKKRKELFRDTMREYTKSMFPILTKVFDDICATSADLHWRRNLVAHGYYELIPNGVLDEDGSQGIKFVANGEVNGRKTSINVDLPTLDKLWHDISHLNADLLVAITQMGGKVSSIDLVIPDIDVLQAEESGNCRLLSISERF
jgi:hypothetical protein